MCVLECVCVYGVCVCVYVVCMVCVCVDVFSRIRPKIHMHGSDNQNHDDDDDFRLVEAPLHDCLSLCRSIGPCVTLHVSRFFGLLVG